MSERLTHITIRDKRSIDNLDELQAGEMCHIKDNIWMVCCPMCVNLGQLSDHTVTQHEDGTLTISPSLVCHGSIYTAPDNYKPCTAHYFIERNQIRWV